MPQTAPMKKIATCCYCGTRAALVLSGDKTHELACSSCGAPLHNLKQIPVARQAAPTPVARAAGTPRGAVERRKVEDKPRKKQRKSRIGRKLLEELWDVVEDIFD